MLPWKAAAREDWQRDRGHHHTAGSHTLPAARHQHTRATSTAERRRTARANVVTHRIDAELSLRDRLPDRLPHQPNQHADIPDWAADRTALTHPATPGSTSPNATGSAPAPCSSTATPSPTTPRPGPARSARPHRRRRATGAPPGPPPAPWSNCGGPATPSPRCPASGPADAWDAMTARIRAFNGGRHLEAIARPREVAHLRQAALNFHRRPIVRTGAKTAVNRLQTLRW